MPQFRSNYNEKRGRRFAKAFEADPRMRTGTKGLIDYAGDESNKDAATSNHEKFGINTAPSNYEQLLGLGKFAKENPGGQEITSKRRLAEEFYVKPDAPSDLGQLFGVSDKARGTKIKSGVEQRPLKDQLKAEWADAYSSPMYDDGKLQYYSDRSQSKHFDKYYKQKSKETGLNFKRVNKAKKADITNFIVPQGFHQENFDANASGMANLYTKGKGKKKTQQWQVTAEYMPGYKSTTTHETGHAIGLSHPDDHHTMGENPYFSPVLKDRGKDSVMSWARDKMNKGKGGEQFGNVDRQVIKDIYGDRMGKRSKAKKRAQSRKGN